MWVGTPGEGQMGFENVERSGAIDYMLRTTQQHHVQLSLLADQKASIMIASSSIVLTFAFANFKQQNLFWGFLALFVFAFFALILAVMAVLPRAGGGTALARKNLLFFGDFTDLTQAEYSAALTEVASSPQAIYDTIAFDIYSLGSALRERKFKYLNLSYRVFLVGLLVAGSLFVLQTALFYLS